MNRIFLGIIISLLSLAALPANAIEIKEVRSQRGITAWLVEDHTNPIITMNIAFRGGAALDPVGKEGVAHLASTTMDEGAGDLDSQSFQQKLEDLSISLRFSAGRDEFTGSLRTLTENRDQAFDLLRLAVTRPRFDSEPVERVRRQILAGLRRSLEDPKSIANRILMSRFFPGHPYGRPTKGTLDTVPLIKLTDLKLFTAQRLARNNLVVAAVGDITAGEMTAALDKIFGDLPEKAASWVLAEAEPKLENRTIIIDKPVPQSIIRFGHRGIKRNDPDFYAAYVMNYILGGGGFESRLFEEVREKRGLAYSAWSYLSPWNHAAVIMGGAGTANERAGDTVKIMRGEWRRMAEKGVTKEELAAAKTYLTGSYALRFSGSRRISSMLVGIQLEKLGIDYIDKRNGFINAVSQDGLNRVAKKLLHPDNLTLVVVGQPKNIPQQP
ncbi:MAG: insulinase family protein [Rhodospirillales bacterium]|nr:insulinase family protein [Rhodospirillales bacterium]